MTARAFLAPTTALLALAGAGCFVARVWMVDYRFDTLAFRANSGKETALPTSRVDDDVDLLATDEHVEFGFRVEPGRIGVSVENRGTEAFSLSLADAAYTDPTGQAHGLYVLVNDDVVHDAALEVAPRSTVQLSLWPEDWNHGSYEGRPMIWKGDSPLGGSTIEETSRDKALANRQGDVGKSFEILLPLVERDERVVYRFRFAVSELMVRKTWWA